MREGTRGHLLSIFCTFWCAGLLRIDARNQQTFVVRYKNGEHTVPVTVVLDYKKQTEYVINMSPRAATKTVTLYDFKQKTIAYKDLTNRECFLGRLTHETLNEETDALTKIQNPVERGPKVLSLDSQRSSLTPTEIRNVAGQKTAIFCGKMNTWLVLSRQAHAVQKREVDEIDERIFHHQGYHTIHYSQFGREIRRRYRNPTSRQSFQRRMDASKIPDWKIGNSEAEPEYVGTSLESPSLQQQSLNLSLLETENSRDFRHPESLRIHGLHPPSTFNPASIQANYNFEKTVSSAPPLDDLKGRNELQVLFTSVTEIPNHRDENGGKRDFSNFQDTSVINGVFANENASFVLKHKPSAHSVLRTPEITETIQRNHTFDLSWDPVLRGDRGELNPLTQNFNADRKKLYSKLSRHEDADASFNVLGTAKITNTEKPLHQPWIPHTNEDVHDVFEGFFNLKENEPSSEQLLHSSHSIPPESNGGRKHSDKFLTNSYPSFSHTRLNSDSNEEESRSENEVITSTDNPGLNTNSYSNYNGATISSTDINSVSDTRALRYKSDNSANLISNPQKFDHSFKTWSVGTMQPVSVKYENTLNEIVDEYFTTENPSYATQEKKAPTEAVGNISSTSLNQEPPNLSHSKIQKVTETSQKVRFQNVLRSYKPDQIIIDVENIPTQTPAEGRLGFQDQVHNLNNHVSPSSSRNVVEPKGEQTSGDTWRSRPIGKTNLPIIKTYDYQPDGAKLLSKKPLQHRRNESHRPHVKNTRHRIYPSPQTLPYPIYNTRPSYKSGGLPLGVSIHPRHPNAPYAGTVHSEALSPAVQGRTTKLHRHRHHKKKDRSANSCCRTRGSCCRSKSLHTKTPCCSSTKPDRNNQRQKQTLIANKFVPQQVQPKSAEDPRNQCQKKKLCRTLYESTQQVMVCRNAKIEGC